MISHFLWRPDPPRNREEVLAAAAFYIERCRPGRARSQRGFLPEPEQNDVLAVIEQMIREYNERTLPPIV